MFGYRAFLGAPYSGMNMGSQQEKEYVRLCDMEDMEEITLGQADGRNKRNRG